MLNTDEELVSQALAMFANFIETGYPTFSEFDLQRIGMREEARLLDENQMKFIARLRSLSIRYDGSLVISPDDNSSD